MASTTSTPPPTTMSLMEITSSLYALPQGAGGLPVTHSETITTATTPTTTLIPTLNRDTITAESHSQTGNYSTIILDALSAVADAVTRSLTLPEVAMTSMAGEQDTSGADGSGDFVFTTAAAADTPTSVADDAPHTDSDEVVGAILQVLLHGAEAAADLTTAQDVASDLDVAVTEGGWDAVTSDMQYSVVTNFTNLTIDLLTNATYRGVLTIGGSAGGNGGGASSPPLQLSRYSLHEGILIGIILSLIVFFSIFGNIVVCAAILSDRNLRKTSNYFIVSLAVADMLVASMVMSFAVANDILGYWIFGETFCSVWISLDIMCSTASIINLCAISLDRYVHIRSPLHYETWVTPLRTCVAMSAVWILSGLISFLPIHLGWHQLGLTPEPTSLPPSPSPASSISSPSSPSTKEHFICMMELNPWYAVVSSMVSFYMPCVVMIAIYLKLYAYARRHVDAIKTQTRTPMLQNGASPKGKTSTYYKMADHKAAITLGVIMGTFLFCWTPFFTINIVGAFCPVCIPTVVFQVFTWLGYFNSTLNPIIYSIFNKEFREAFKRVLNFRRCCRRRDDDFRRPIKYTETYGTVSRKSLTKQNDEVTAV